MPLDLLEAADQLISGILDPSTAEAEVRAFAESARREVIVHQLGEVGHRMMRCESVVQLRDLARVAEVASKHVGQWGLGSVLLNYGNAMKRLDAFEEATAALERSVDILKNYTDPSDHFLYEHHVCALCSKGEVLVALGRTAEGKACIERALLLTEGDAEPFLRTFALLTLSEVHRLTREFDAAIAAQREALRLRSSLPNGNWRKHGVGERAALEYAIGRIAREAGQFEVALAAFTRAYDGFPEGEMGRAVLASEIGLAWLTLGEDARARKILTQAASEAERLGDTALAKQWRLQAGIEPPRRGDEGPAASAHQAAVEAEALLHSAEPDYDKARKLLLLSIAVAEEARNLDTVALARCILGLCYYREGNFWQAIGSLKIALELAERLRDDVLLLKARSQLAESFLRVKEAAQAEREVRAAIDTGEKLRRTALSGDVRQSIGGVLANCYARLIYLLTRHGPDTRGKHGHDAEEALVFGQRTRSVNLLARMSRKDEDRAHDVETAGALERLRESDVRLEMAQYARSEVSGLGRALKQHQESLELLQRRLRVDEFEELARARFPEQEPKSLAKKLQPDECLLDVMSIEEGVAVTRLDSDGRARSSGARWIRTEREQWFRAWMRALNVPQSRWRLDNVRGLRDEQGDVLESVAIGDLLRDLDSLFAPPLLELLYADPPVRRAYVVPHREFFIVPFSHVAAQVPNLGISILPNSALLALRNEPTRTDNVRLALGDATKQLRWAERELADLPGFEVIRPDSPADVVKTLRRASMFHFAGHGWFDPINPYKSGLVACTADEGSDLDQTLKVKKLGSVGLLTTARIMAALRMPEAHLVVLSGCSTGVPRDHPSSEFTSLPAAFFLAGARNVIASLWPVDDGATYLLMEQFYQSLDAGSSPSAALDIARGKLAAMTRAEVVKRLGDEGDVPHGARPYAESRHQYAFQHYGLD
jgi:tetratricopeptide (TPR) repeat protein